MSPAPRKPRAKKIPDAPARGKGMDKDKPVSKRSVGATQAAVDKRRTRNPGPSRKPLTKMSIAQRAARARMICEMKSRGYTWKDIAERVELSEPQCKNIWRAESEHVDILEQNPVDVVKEVLEGYRHDVAMFQAAAVAAADTGDLNTMMNAMKGGSQTKDKMVRLLVQTGRMPRDMGDLRHFIDFPIIARSMYACLEFVADGRRTPAEAQAFFRSITTEMPRGRVPQIDQEILEAAMRMGRELAEGTQEDGEPEDVKAEVVS